MRSLFKVLALTALIVSSGSAMAQLSGPGVASSTPGATTYGATNQRQWAPAGSSSSTPGYATYGSRTIPNQVGNGAPYQQQPQGLIGVATVPTQQFLYTTPP